MKLEKKFLKVFFFPFLIGISLSIVIVSFILSYYSSNFLNKESAKMIYKLEKQYSTINLNSINVIISNVILKIQVALQEQISFYKHLASQISDNEKRNRKIQEYTKCAMDESFLDIEAFEKKYKNELDYISMWFIDPTTNEEKLNENVEQNAFQQISLFSNLIQLLYSALSSMKNILISVYFMFEDTNLFAIYPYSHCKRIQLVQNFKNYPYNPVWCTDDEGNKINYYKFKCREFYTYILKAQSNIYDYNYQDQTDRKIFIIPPVSASNIFHDESIFTICIKFITLGNKNLQITKWRILSLGDRVVIMSF